MTRAVAGLAGLAAAAGLALLPLAAASAYPEGAPLDALDDPGEACAACHFDGDPVADSPALSLHGADGPLLAGETYRLTLRFAPQEAELAGFLASFRRDGDAAGVVTAEDGLEGSGATLRSIEALPLPADGAAEWSFCWHAPEEPGPSILHVAANAANDDASPFGDTVHMRSFTLNVE